MLRKDELYIGASRLSRLSGIGMHHHTFLHRGVAGRKETFIPFHLHHADPAGADLIQILPITEGRDFDPRLFGSFQDRGLFFHAHILIVDCQIYH